jgi:hypothetical protein
MLSLFKHMYNKKKKELDDYFRWELVQEDIDKNVNN